MLKITYYNEDRVDNDYVLVDGQPEDTAEWYAERYFSELWQGETYQWIETADYWEAIDYGWQEHPQMPGLYYFPE